MGEAIDVIFYPHETTTYFVHTKSDVYNAYNMQCNKQICFYPLYISHKLITQREKIVWVAMIASIMVSRSVYKLVYEV